MDEANVTEPVELVIFDIGRVLLRIADNWADACARAGVTMPEEGLGANEATLHQLSRAYESGRLAVDAYLAEVSTETGLSEQEIRRIYDAWLLGPYPGIHDLVDELVSDGVRTACLSNTNDLHWEMFFGQDGPNGLGLERLDWQFASHLIGHAKPAEAIYAHVENETGILPRRMLFFDDLEENVLAARHRGWQAHVIANDGDPVAQVRGHLTSHGVL